MKIIVSTLGISLVLTSFLSLPLVHADSYKDWKAYQDYLKLPDKYKSPEMEEMYKNAYEAQIKVKRLPCISGGTVEHVLIKKPVLQQCKT